MPTSFPTSLDSYSDPSGTGTLASESHSGHHANHNDAIEALETKVGVDSSADTSSIDYRVNALEDGRVAGRATLVSAFSITGASGVYQDTGLEVTLPSAGTYLINYNVRVSGQTSSGSGWISVRLYDETAAAAITDSERLTFYPVTTSNIQQHVAYSELVTVSAASTIRLEANRNLAAGWSTSDIASNSDGRTTMSYVRVI